MRQRHSIQSKTATIAFWLHSFNVTGDTQLRAAWLYHLY